MTLDQQRTPPIGELSLSGPLAADISNAVVRLDLHLDRALAPGVGVADDVRARLGHRELDVLHERRGQLQGLRQRTHHMAHEHDVLRTRGQRQPDVAGRIARH